LLTLRCGLHFLSGKPHERLSFVWQPELAQRLGTRAPTPNRAAERLMRRYHLATRGIQQLGWEETATPTEDKSPLVLTPVAALQWFLDARISNTPVTPQEMAAIRRYLTHLPPAGRDDPGALALLTRLLTEPFADAGRDLRQLADCGLLGTFLPDFGRTTGLMQFDQYHVYTVDAHTLAAMALAHRLACGLEAEAFPLATQLWQGLRRKRVLMLAVLFHDIAKGRGGDHAVVGEEVALAVCPHLGCDADEAALIGWLVRQHLLLSFYAFKRDVQDPDTVRSFAGTVQTVERLRLLYLLTVIDIKATNPAILNSWKLSLLGELYTQTEDLLSGGLAEEGREARITAARDRLAAELNDWSDAERARWLAALPGPYWLAFSLPEQRTHFQMLRQIDPADPNDLVCRFHRNLAQDVTEVALCTRDRPGLFALFAGVMALAGTSIVEARIFTLDNGYVLDRFAVQEKGAAVRWDDRLERLADKVRAAWAGRLDVDAALRALPVDPPPVAADPPHVGIDNTTSPRFTIVEVTAPDRRGLLFRLLTVLRDAGLQVMRAKISTFGATASDVFYLVDGAGGKIEDAERLATLRQGLLAALAGM
jgi:[protein-PII] uridylyltransferase